MKRAKEWCDNIRKSKIGLTHTEETKKKISEAHMGKTLSEEHKKKCSKASTQGNAITRKKQSERMRLWWAKRKAKVA